MKKIFYLGILLGLLSACQENKMDGFDSNGAVYFQTNPSGTIWRIVCFTLLPAKM